MSVRWHTAVVHICPTGRRWRLWPLHTSAQHRAGARRPADLNLTEIVIFKGNILYFIYFVWATMCGGVLATAWKWRSEDNLWESALFFHHMGDQSPAHKWLFPTLIKEDKHSQKTKKSGYLGHVPEPKYLKCTLPSGLWRDVTTILREA